MDQPGYGGVVVAATLVQPVVRMAFMLLGQTPAVMFENLDRFFALVTRGITFSYTAENPRSGVLLAHFDGPDTPEAAFHVLQGSLQFIFELCGVPGTVDSAQVVESTDASATVRYQVRW